MRLHTFIPMLDLFCLIVFCLLVEDRGTDPVEREVEITAASPEQSVTLRVLGSGYEVDGRRYDLDDPRFLQVLRTLRSAGRNLGVRVARDTSSCRLFQAMGVLESAGYERASIKPEEG